MIDWHSHVLPGIDDGSRDEGESIALLKALQEQRVGQVIATPHFYAEEESVEKFLQRRAAAFDRLQAALQGGEPAVLLGAEVYYYMGIRHNPDLEKLCIGNTRLLLLEMPMGRWTEYIVRELVDLATCGEVRLVLAHVERYWDFQKKSVWKRLYQSGVLMQVNASFFNEIKTRGRALKLLKKGMVQLIGSDCHNLKERRPQIGKAFELIERKFGEELLGDFHEYGYALLQGY